MASAEIVDTPLNRDALEARIAPDEHGAVCVFIGQVRNHSRGKQVASLEYRAYMPLAEKQLLRVAEDAEKRWGCQVALWHRLGIMKPGDASVAVAVSAPHRAEAFEACRYCIDTLKALVPIWKRETCPDGTWWIEGEEAFPASEER